MKKIMAIAGALLLVASVASAQSEKTQGAGTDKPASDKAQSVTIAEILKVDAKKKILDVRNIPQTPPSDSGTSRRQSGPAPSTNGIPGGGSRRRPGGVGFPGGGGGGRPYPGGGPSVVTNQPKEYKVYVTNDTVMKLFNTTIDFSDLHVSDRIALSGTPKGKTGDIEATAITRDPPQ